MVVSFQSRNVCGVYPAKQPPPCYEPPLCPARLGLLAGLFRSATEPVNDALSITANSLDKKVYQKNWFVQNGSWSLSVSHNGTMAV